MKQVLLSLVGGAALLSAATSAQATSYTSDPTLSDFLVGDGNYATLSNYFSYDSGAAPPYTPTDASLSSGLRVYQGDALNGLPGSDWILATFSSPVSSIRVFPSIDHFGDPYDGYQYTIYGSNDGLTWTPLFDATSVSGSGEPFTLGTFTGTAPTNVNNVLTPGSGPAGTVGYIADFTFDTAYTLYAFGASTVSIADSNPDQELSAVGGLSAPLPAALPLFVGGVGALGLLGWRRKRKGSVEAAA